MTLAVYRSMANATYFIAPSGLSNLAAHLQRVSPYYRDQLQALDALIDAQHDVNRSNEETSA